MGQKILVNDEKALVLDGFVMFGVEQKHRGFRWFCVDKNVEMTGLF